MRYEMPACCITAAGRIYLACLGGWMLPVAAVAKGAVRRVLHHLDRKSQHRIWRISQAFELWLLIVFMWCPWVWVGARSQLTCHSCLPLAEQFPNGRVVQSMIQPLFQPGKVVLWYLQCCRNHRCCCSALGATAVRRVANHASGDRHTQQGLSQFYSQGHCGHLCIDCAALVCGCCEQIARQATGRAALVLRRFKLLGVLLLLLAAGAGLHVHARRELHLDAAAYCEVASAWLLADGH